MADTRFHAELFIDKQGFLTGKVRIPSDHAAALEAINECINVFAKTTNKTHHEILSDLMRLNNVHKRSG